ncbi:MAG: hypothetical protein MJZ57_07465 [Bacteroidales bacterium]|nr:hypothetical protein [Bacteroidales bacterium]
MNDRDIFDFINDNFTMRANVNCYNKLNCFADAMRSNLIHNSRIIRYKNSNKNRIFILK